jgi:glycosyltransferase involved in cell wall biosynthesis
LRVAIVHDWLVNYAGSERVLEQLIALFPRADLFSLVDFLPPERRGFLAGRPVATSFLQRMPFARRTFRACLPLMPLAVEQLDLSAYDLVISSSHCVAKGVLTGPDQLHVSYVHTPMRYAWDAQREYLAGAGLDRGLRGWCARWMLHKLRGWDARSTNGVDALVANSQFIARRVEKAWRRTARVIYPPVDVDAFALSKDREDFYVTASRLVPYKKVDVLVEAFAHMPQRRLIVIGDGPQRKKLAARAPANVQVLGHQSFEFLRSHLERARAFVYAAREDFGIVLAEAQACGCPVIAFSQGGAAEIVRPLTSERPTGVLFDAQTPQAVVDAVAQFERHARRIDPADCRAGVLRFDAERFRREFFDYAMREWADFNARRSASRPAPSLRVA